MQSRMWHWGGGSLTIWLERIELELSFATWTLSVNNVDLNNRLRSHVLSFFSLLPYASKRPNCVKIVLSFLYTQYTIIFLLKNVKLLIWKKLIKYMYELYYEQIWIDMNIKETCYNDSVYLKHKIGFRDGDGPVLKCKIITLKHLLIYRPILVTF